MMRGAGATWRLRWHRCQRRTAAGSPVVSAVGAAGRSSNDRWLAWLLWALWLLTASPPTWAGVAYVASSTAGGAAPTASITVNAPAGLVAGDLMLAMISQRTSNLPLDQNMVSTPVGWTLVLSQDDGSTVGMSIYRKVATASEPANFTWTLGSSGRTSGAILAFSGVDTTSPIDASGSQANLSSTSCTAPSVSTTSTNTMRVVLFSMAQGNTAVNPANGMTQAFSAASGAGPNGVAIGGSYAALSAAGATGSAVSTGNPAAVNLGASVALRAMAAVSVDHYELRHASGIGVTCSPSSLTIAACQDAACTTLYTGGVSGTLSASGAGMSMNWPDSVAFSIPSGSGTVNWRIQQTTVGSMSLSASGVTPAPSNASSCNFGSPSCTWTAADAGFVFNVLDHVAEVAQTVSVSAVRKSDSSLACSPAFASLSKSVTFKCGYTNPGTGTLPVRVGAVALNASGSSAAACDSGGKAVSLAFDATGLASTTVQYADVGQMLLSASYSGIAGSSEAGLVMSGSDAFIAAPASFAFSAISAGPIKAGTPFSASVTARNSAAATTPNFGRESGAESVVVSFTRASPTGVGANDGSFSGILGGFSGGVASGSGFIWNEVGSGDLSARLFSGNYLGAGLTATGSTGVAGAVGSFIPHHFDVVVTPACAGSFSYAGQPFNLSVIARSGIGFAATTLNYDGSSKTSPNQAKAVTLSDANALGLGSLSGSSVPASAFSAGVATASASYAFSAKLTAPQTLKLRAIDGNGVSSSGFAEGSTPLRSGRLRVSSAYGAATAPLQVALAADYWSGSAWLLNSADTCTSLPAAAVVLSNPRGYQGGSVASSSSGSAVSLASGSGLLSLSAPSPAVSGVTFDLALNLGSTGLDQSCQASHPGSTGAALPWLRSNNGACAASADRDPAARVSFGIFSPETRKTVHVRELF